MMRPILALGQKPLRVPVRCPRICIRRLWNSPPRTGWIGNQRIRLQLVHHRRSA